MIEVKNLSKTYHNKDGNVLALDNVSFQLGNKGIVFLFGASGEGKSTLSNVLSGLDVYDKGGKILYNGKDLMEMSQHERDVYRSKEIGLIFEQDNLIETLTVKENITNAKEVSGDVETDDQVPEVLKKVKLNGYEKRNIVELSSGERQRVAIARMLLLNPRVLFVDEPTGHLDQQNSRMFWEIVREQSKQCLVVAITHERDIVEQYADRVLEIKSGKVVRDRYLSQVLKEEDKQLFSSEVQPTTLTKRAYLSPKTSTKLGLKVLQKGRFRLISLLVLTCFTLMTFALSYLLSTYNSSLIMAKSAKLQNLSYVTFENKTTGQAITQEQLASLYDNKTGEYYKIYSTDLVIKFFDKTATPFAIGGIMEVDSKIENNYNVLGQKVLYGTYPSTTEKTNKIAISDYLAQLLNRNGISVRYNNGTQFETLKNAGIDRLIGKEIAIDGEYFEISAIYATNYAEFVDDQLKVKEGCETDFAYNLTNNYSMIHTATGNVKEFVATATLKDNINLTLDTTSLAHPIVRTVNIKTFALASDYNILGTKTVLGKYDILLPIGLFNEIFSAQLDAVSYLNDATVTDNMTTAALHITSQYGETITYNITGVTQENYMILADNSDTNTLDGYFGGLVEKDIYPTLKIATACGSEKQLTKAIDAVGEKGFVYVSQYSDEISNVSEVIELLGVVFTVATVFFALFCMYFMFTFFANVIANNKKIVGALRTLGANSFNLMAIFMVSCVLIMLVSVVAGMLLSVLSSLILNQVVMSTFALPISILNINFGMFGWIALLGVVISFVGSIIPIAFYCVKTPVDVLKR